MAPEDGDDIRSDDHAPGDVRASVPGKGRSLPVLTDEEEARIEARNALLQADVMLDMIAGALEGPKARGFRLRPSTICELQKPAVLDLKLDAGYFRQARVTISGTGHEPPPPEEVQHDVDEMCEYVNDNWSTASAIHIAAYVMWRHNWIHPFMDGNGRTSRCLSYLLLCVKLGYRLPGEKPVPERIAEHKTPYYHALDHADAAWKSGRLDVSVMEALLEQKLADQLVSIHERATGKLV